MEAGTMGRTAAPGGPRTTGVRRLATETKAFIKASQRVVAEQPPSSSESSSAQPSSRAATRAGRMSSLARQAWLYVAIVAGAYAIGRGLAKSGSNEPYFAERDGDDLGNAGARNGDDR